jgi:hypothetical protein
VLTAPEEMDRVMIMVKIFSIRGVSKKLRKNGWGKEWTQRENTLNMDLF